MANANQFNYKIIIQKKVENTQADEFGTILATGEDAYANWIVAFAGKKFYTISKSRNEVPVGELLSGVAYCVFTIHYSRTAANISSGDRLIDVHDRDTIYSIEYANPDPKREFVEILAKRYDRQGINEGFKLVP